MQVWCEGMEIVSSTVKLPQASGDRPPRPINTHNARDFQKLYRRNHRRRAVRLMFDGPSRLCPNPLAALEDHIESTWAQRPANTFHPPCADPCCR